MKGIQIGKKESKLFPFAEIVKLSVFFIQKNPKASPRKLPDLVNKFCKVASSKFSTLKGQLYFYIYQSTIQKGNQKSNFIYNSI